ncbi:MAG: YSIRK-type signal peptide-containing protein [Gemella sp.]|nr:YSIRK-type signal peptide-containing protein [Gemella sp.]
MFNNKNNSTKQKFSIKKYSFGVTSALVGVFLAAGVNSAQAEEVPSTSSEPIPTAVALEPSNSDLKINTTASAEPTAATTTPITTELATENVPVSPVATSSTADIEPVAVTATPEASQVLSSSQAFNEVLDKPETYFVSDQFKYDDYTYFVKSADSEYLGLSGQRLLNGKPTGTKDVKFFVYNKDNGKASLLTNLPAIEIEGARGDFSQEAGNAGVPMDLSPINYKLFEDVDGVVNVLKETHGIVNHKRLRFEDSKITNHEGNYSGVIDNNILEGEKLIVWTPVSQKIKGTQTAPIPSPEIATLTTEEEAEVVRLVNLYITSKISPRFYTLSELGEQVTAPDAAASYFIPKSVVTASYNALSTEEITKEEALKKFLEGVSVEVVNGNFNETLVLNKVNDKKQELGAPGPLTFVLDFENVDSLYVYTNEPFGVLGKTVIGDRNTWVKAGEKLIVPVHYIDPVGNSVETTYLTLLSNNKVANLFGSDGFVGKFFVYYIAGVSNLSQPTIPTQPNGNLPSKENPQSGKFKSTNKVTKSKANVLPKTSATETNSALPAGLAALLTAAGLMTVKRRKN